MPRLTDRDLDRLTARYAADPEELRAALVAHEDLREVLERTCSALASARAERDEAESLYQRICKVIDIKATQLRAEIEARR